jgi:deoxyribodipyrimidine photo-lyase
VTTALVWFRQDLRLADNPALDAAVHAADHVIPVFIWSAADEGNWVPGAAAQWWLHRSLQELAVSLAQRGSKLVLRCGDTVENLLDIAKTTGATQFYWNCRYEPAARRVDEALRQRLHSAGFIGHGFHSSRLAEPGAVKSASGTPYQIFTPFWRAFLQQVQIDAPLPSPKNITAPAKWPSSLTLEDLALLPQHPWHEALARHWQPGEAAGRDALKQFVAARLDQYDSARDRPGMGGASRLSPYLRHGELSPRQVWTAVCKQLERSGIAPDSARTHKFLAELVWREFATQQLVLHPTLPDRARLAPFDRIPWREDAAESTRWRRGTTGFPMVDAGMRELWQTGWMHNRVRMITASFLIKNLLHDWREGERWFWDTLVDADLASNALNWQWVAGTSPDAAPWFRIFNVETQAEKFDPDGVYQERYVPEAKSLHYPRPMVDLKQTRQRALDTFGQHTKGQA